MLIAAGFVGGYFTGRATNPDVSAQLASDVEARHRIYAGQPHAQDAMRRWAEKDGISVERAMRGRTIEVMHFPDRECVAFDLELGAVGGVPIYCYRVDGSSGVPRTTTELIFEYSNVE